MCRSPRGRARLQDTFRIQLSISSIIHSFDSKLRNELPFHPRCCRGSMGIPYISNRVDCVAGQEMIIPAKFELRSLVNFVKKVKRISSFLFARVSIWYAPLCTTFRLEPSDEAILTLTILKIYPEGINTFLRWRLIGVQHTKPVPPVAVSPTYDGL